MEVDGSSNADIQINHQLFFELGQLNNKSTIATMLKPDEALYLNCNGCDKTLNVDDLNSSDIVICEKCKKVYCLDCDIFIHETLLSCPTCELIS